MTVEAFPETSVFSVVKGAAETFPKKWTLLFQGSVDARRQLARDRHNGFARGDFLRVQSS
jgi:hypothetical protein